MKTRLWIILPALFAMTACSNSPAPRLSDKARQIERTLTSEYEARNYVFPVVSSEVMVQAFERYCVRPAFAMIGLAEELEKDGYELFLTSHDGTEMYNNTDGQPTISYDLNIKAPPIGDSAGCMVMAGYSANTRQELDDYAKRRNLEASDKENLRPALYFVDEASNGILGTSIRIRYITGKNLRREPNNPV